MKLIQKIAICSLALLNLFACGGGGGGGGTGTGTGKKVTLAFSTYVKPGSTLSDPLQIIHLIVRLPAGVNVSKDTCTLIGKNSNGSLKDEMTAYSGQSINFQIQLQANDISNNTSIDLGQFADLTCTLAGSTLQTTDFEISQIISANDTQLTGWSVSRSEAVDLNPIVGVSSVATISN